MLIERVEGPGGLRSIEVPNDQISRRMVVEVLAVIPGVTLVRRPSLLWSLGGDQFCEFRIGAERYVVSEMFGDSDRYDISPLPGSDGRHLPDLAAAFERFKRLPFDVPLVMVDAGVRGFVLLALLVTLPDLVSSGSAAYALQGLGPLFLWGPLLVVGVAACRRLWARMHARRIAGGPLTMQ